MTRTPIDLAAFRAPRFAPVLPDRCQVNPGSYGAELAFWLCIELAMRDVFTSYPSPEDWGWYLEFPSERGLFVIGCGSEHGTNDRWVVFLQPVSRKWFGRKLPPLSDARTLIVALETILRTEAAITELEWRFVPA